MPVINLKDYYYYLKEDVFIEVEDDISKVYDDFDKKKSAVHRQMFRNKAQYSLDVGDGIEHDAVFMVASPEEVYMRKVTVSELYSAMSKLTKKQSRRIYAHYYLDMSKASIAKAENTTQSAIGQSIDTGLRQLEKILKK